VREELSALAGEPVAEVTAATAEPPPDQASAPDDPPPLGDARVVVGTEAVLHRSLTPDVVAFLDLDADLLAPRYRAAEQVLGQLGRAARLLGGRARGGRLLLQTRQPGHDVVEAVFHADPGRWAKAEAARRRELSLPPFAALAHVSGAGAATFVESLASGDPRGGVAVPNGPPDRVTVLGPVAGRYLVRARDAEALADALADARAAVPAGSDPARVEVDPADA
jgi:primosomal protein N' (replication factor Y)